MKAKSKASGRKLNLRRKVGGGVVGGKYGGEEWGPVVAGFDLEGENVRGVSVSSSKHPAPHSTRMLSRSGPSAPVCALDRHRVCSHGGSDMVERYGHRKGRSSDNRNRSEK